MRMIDRAGPDIPLQAGRIAVVTGASSGIGEEAASVLAAKGARVILAVRNADRGEDTCARIVRRHPGASVEVSIVDMASLASVRAFAIRCAERLSHVDILLNNAGLGLQPARSVTVDGYERQFATNHLGHFALTGLMMPVLLRAPAPRVVTISSIAHRFGRIDFDDLQGERRYRGERAYTQSKLANLLFALELDRRARAQDAKLISVAAHPGIARTRFFEAVDRPRFVTAASNLAVGLVGQNAMAGAWPGLHAATGRDVVGGQYWGPGGVLELRGFPTPARIADRAFDRVTAERLWQASKTLTGVRYEFR